MNLNQHRSIAYSSSLENRKYVIVSSDEDNSLQEPTEKKFGSQINVNEKAKGKSGNVAPVPARKVFQGKKAIQVATLDIIRELNKKAGGCFQVIEKPFRKVQMYFVEQKLRKELEKMVSAKKIAAVKGYTHVYVCEEGVVGSNYPLDTEK